MSSPLDHGGGVTGDLVRAHAWAATALGPIASWPRSLATTVETLLATRQPMLLFWGTELVQIYNDAFLPSFGRGKHPAAMGQRAVDCWAEIWPLIGPEIEDVLARGVTYWREDAMVPIGRNDRFEEVYWTYSYSPVFAEDRTVGGVLVVCVETTARVFQARRQRLFRAFAERTSGAPADDAVIAILFAELAALREDVPFAAHVAPDGRALVRTLGLSTAGEAALLAALAGAAPMDGPRVLPVAPIEAAPWPEPVTAVFEVPCGPRGSLVFGLSARQTFDAGYRAFLEQIVEATSQVDARLSAQAARAAAEVERRDLLLQAPVATAIMTGPLHRFELANPLYVEMVGREVAGKTYLEAFPELAATALPGILDGVYRDGVPFVTNELLVPLDRGAGLVDCYFKFNLQPIRDASGQVYGMMAVAVEMTDFVSASRAKDEFLAMLGHELRNPLAPIVTALDLVELRTPDVPPTREHALIRRQVSHLTRLVDDLLDVSKIARGKIELRREVVELADVVAKAIELAESVLDARGHRLEVQLPPEPVRWWGDPVRLAQVLANLLTNAARYTPRNGDVALTARHDGDAIAIAVTDNGSGIAPELLPKVFDLFVQGRRSAERAEGGLGLGLALVKSLVALHGGTVSAASAGLGHGSEFVVRLPLTRVPTDELAAVAPAAAAAASKRVLVVDDNADAAEMLAELLRARGHRVAVANDGLAALEMVAGFRPEVAIPDLGLPVIDGYELAGRIAAATAPGTCRLVAVTGYGQAGDRARTQAAGFAAHLVKPVTLAALTSAVSGISAVSDSR